MTQTIGGDLEARRAALGGPVIGPDDEGYDDARTSPCAAARTTRPAPRSATAA